MAEQSNQIEESIEEDSNVAKDMLGGLRSLLKERLVSPLFPAFIISWLMWNYRVVLTICSDEKLETKFKIVDQMFPTGLTHVWDGVLVPLLFALIYIYIYPWFSIPVYKFSLSRQRKLREARQKADNEKLLSEADKKKLLAFTFDQKEKYEKQLDQRMQEIEQLNAKIEQLEKENSVATEAIAGPFKPGQILTADALNTALAGNKSRRLPDRDEETTEGMLKVLAQLAEFDGVDKSKLRAGLPTMERLKVEHYLDQLIEGGFVRTSLGNLYMNPRGRTALLKKNLDVQ